MPAGYRGTPRGQLYIACRANADAGDRAMPTSARQIARILNPMVRRDSPLSMSNGMTAECVEQEIDDVAAKANAPCQRRRKGSRA